MTLSQTLRNCPTLFWAIMAAILGLLLFASISWQVGNRLVAPMQVPVGPCPSDLAGEPVLLGSSSGSIVSGWYVPGDRDQGTVILLHSIRRSRLQMVDRARFLNRNGYSVLLIDLQSHGESSGECITAGHLERFDVRAAVDFAHLRKPENPVAVVGISLGGAATVLASPLKIDAAVLESVYPTIDEAIGNRIRQRLGPLSPIAKEILLLQMKMRLGISPAALRPVDHIGALSCPVLVMAGSEDRLTPKEETKRLFQAAGERKQLIFFEGAGHVDLYQFDPNRYTELLLDFLEEHLQQQ